jgi:uncharacterized protein (TIGR03089 family)
MPGHWLAFGVVFGCWFAGLELTSDISTCDVAFVADEYVQDVLSVPANVGERIAVSLLPMARPGQPPPGWLDYATAVRPMPDAWPLVRSQAGASDLAQPATSRRDLTSLAREWAVARSLPERARVQVSTGWPDLAGMTATLLGPLAVGGSLVLTRNLSPQRQAAVARDERAMALD